MIVLSYHTISTATQHPSLSLSLSLSLDTPALLPTQHQTPSINPKPVTSLHHCQNEVTSLGVTLYIIARTVKHLWGSSLHCPNSNTAREGHTWTFKTLLMELWQMMEKGTRERWEEQWENNDRLMEIHFFGVFCNSVCLFLYQKHTHTRT